MPIKQYFSLERCTSIAYQTIFLIITLLILSAILYKPVAEFHPVGNKPMIEPLSSLPAQPARVSTGMHIIDFLKFDTVKNEFIMNAFIWFSYDPKKVKTELINAFTFTKGEILQKSEPRITMQDGITTALYTIRVQFSSILDYQRFPIDDHRLFLNLTNPLVTADQMVYVSEDTNYKISPTIYLSGWHVVGHAVESGYAPVVLSDTQQFLQPKTVFSLDVSKNDLRQLFLIIFPLLFLFYLGLFTFAIRDITIAMTLPLASVASLFAYSFVIQTIAPMVGYMMISDYLFLFFLLSTFIIFAVKALEIVPEHILSRHNLRRIEGFTVVALQVALIIVWYCLISI